MIIVVSHPPSPSFRVLLLIKKKTKFSENNACPRIFLCCLKSKSKKLIHQSYLLNYFSLHIFTHKCEPLHNKCLCQYLLTCTVQYGKLCYICSRIISEVVFLRTQTLYKVVPTIWTVALVEYRLKLN